MNLRKEQGSKPTNNELVGPINTTTNQEYMLDYVVAFANNNILSKNVESQSFY